MEQLEMVLLEAELLVSLQDLRQEPLVRENVEDVIREFIAGAMQELESEGNTPEFILETTLPELEAYFLALKQLKSLGVDDIILNVVHEDDSYDYLTTLPLSDLIGEELDAGKIVKALRSRGKEWQRLNGGEQVTQILWWVSSDPHSQYHTLIPDENGHYYLGKDEEGEVRRVEAPGIPCAIGEMLDAVPDERMSVNQFMYDYGLWAGLCSQEGSSDVTPRHYMTEFASSVGLPRREDMFAFLKMFTTDEDELNAHIDETYAW